MSYTVALRFQTKREYCWSKSELFSPTKMIAVCKVDPTKAERSKPTIKNPRQAKPAVT